jgi:hypothetical protein
MTTSYPIGRSVVRGCILLGYVLGAIFGATFGVANKTNAQVIIGALLGCVIIGILAHGFYQAILALFDISDHARESNRLAQVHRSALRQSPPPTSAPIPGADLHPGETDIQWAKRIEREDAAAFRARAAKT